ncbi:MAG: hypothetical protein Q4D40_02695, partial [Eubacteriales bacterium]|nr:hypothetical protein [Eubacteriales bacterium]
MAQKKANSKKNTAASGRTNGASASSKTKGRGRTTTREDKRKTAKKKSFLKTEITAIVCILSGCLLILADLGLMGGLGEVVYGVQRGLFGQAYMVSSAAIIAAAVIGIKQKGSGLAGIKLVSVFLLLVTIVSLCELMFGHSVSDGSTAAGLYDAARNGADGGGAVGGIITGALVSVIGKAGSLFVYAALIIICAVVITEKSFVTAARTGAERTASAVKVGAGKTIEAARNGHEHYRQAVRENVIRRDAMKEEKRLRRLEMSFKELEPAGDISGDRVEEPDLAGLKENGMDTVRDSEIYRAELYAGYGRDIIGDSQPGVDTLGDVRTPIFRPVIDNNRSTEGVSFDTEVISGVDGYAQESASKEAVNIRSIDYDSDEVPFDVNEEDEYRSYAYILRGESISINAAKQAGYAVGKKSVNDIGRDGGSLQHIKHMAALTPHDAGSLFDTAARHDTDEERNIAENAAELYRDIGGGSYIGINAAADAA